MNLLARIIPTLSLGLLAAGAMAQGAKPTHDERIDSIMFAVHERFEEQVGAWYQRGDYPRCIQLRKVQVEVWPEDYDAVADLGLFLESTDQKAAALAAYITYRKRNPDEPDRGLLEAFFYSRMKAYAKIPPILEPVLRNETNPHPNVYRQLAHAYEKMDLLADAERVWKAYIETDPKDRAAERNLDRVKKKLAGAG